MSLYYIYLFKFDKRLRVGMRVFFLNKHCAETVRLPYCIGCSLRIIFFFMFKFLIYIRKCLRDYILYYALKTNITDFVGPFICFVCIRVSNTLNPLFSTKLRTYLFKYVKNTYKYILRKAIRYTRDDCNITRRTRSKIDDLREVVGVFFFR